MKVLVETSQVISAAHHQLRYMPHMVYHMISHFRVLRVRII